MYKSKISLCSITELVILSLETVCGLRHKCASTVPVHAEKQALMEVSNMAVGGFDAV